MRALDRRLVRRARPVRVLLALDVALGMVSAGFVLAQAVLLAWIVVRAFDGGSLRGVAPELVVLGLVFAGRGVVAWAFEVAGLRAASSVLSQLRLELIAQRLRAHPAALDGVEAGELAASAVGGLAGLESYFGRYLPGLVLACLVPPAVLVSATVIDPVSGLVMLVTLPLVPVFMWLIGRFAEERARARWQALRLLSTRFLDVVRGLPTLRAYNRSRAQVETIAAVGEEYRRATMGTLRVAFLSGSVLELASTLGIALVAVTVGVRLDDGGVGFQAALTVLLLAPELYAPLRRLGTQFHASADGLAAAGRLFELLDLEPTLAAVEEPAPPVGTIRLEDVTVVYPRGPAVEDVSATLVPGQRVALAGPSGAGKTTLLSLLLRLADPTSGRVLVDGVDLARCDPAGWRAQLAWLPQRPRLAPGTLRDALDDGRGLTDTALLAAMVRAGAPPLSLDAVLGERTPLSAGEIRRLALARALALPKPLLLLDEPTTSLDPASADTVRDAIAALPRDGLVVFATHDPELIALADVVVELAPRLREQVA